MRTDKFTVKLQEALQDTISLATEYGHQQVEPEHLFISLLRQDEGIVAPIMDKLGIQTVYLIKLIEEDLRKKPSISGANAQVYFSGRMNKLLASASKEAQGLKDDFISGEHILLAILTDTRQPPHH
ncbi:MAG: hypothetical protein NT033_01535 [Candidatus Omnitrophica bacterium]|nr:hypothetical protein [Candidatus Omnitrophota bacterium]